MNLLFMTSQCIVQLSFVLELPREVLSEGYSEIRLATVSVLMGMLFSSM